MSNTSEQARRKELRAQYKQMPPEAGVYRIVNNRNDKVLLGSTLNLTSMRSKLEFAKSTNATGGFDWRRLTDLPEFGIEAFSLEVLDVLPITPEMTPTEIREDLALLEQLWREKHDPRLLY